MRAAIDFALCGRTPRSCARHADCASAQFSTLNQERQAFVWPKDTGSLCGLFHDFAPYRTLASLGGGIADSLAPSEPMTPGKTSMGDSAEDARGVARDRAQFAGPSTGKHATGSGEPGVASDTARHMPTPAGENFGAADFASSGSAQANTRDIHGDTQAAASSLPAGLDSSPEFGFIVVAASAVPSAAEDCPDANAHFRGRAELPSAGTTASSRPALDHSQLRAARILRP